MKKLSLLAIGMYVSMLAAFSQTAPDSAYKKKKLSLDEVNFVSGYYSQDGNNSAVTGGIGTEKLTDFANTIELKFSKYRRPSIKRNLSFEMGIDHYTSASSDKIDPQTISSASYSDTRFYPSLGWSSLNENSKTLFGINLSASSEYDYTSAGIVANFSKTSKDNNREFSTRLQAYFDTWNVIYPVELRGSAQERKDKESGSARNSFSGALSLSQVINKNLQLVFITEPTYQQGLLATRYQRVYFTDGSVHAEMLPGTRVKMPVGIRANYFFSDRFIIRSFYRYYQDTWGLRAHTAELELPVKLSPFFSVSPFYRFYAQNAVRYFAPFQQHSPASLYYSSDYDLSKFTSGYVGANLRIVPQNGVLGIQRFHSAELRFGHYSRSNGLTSNQLTLALQFK